MTNDLEKSLGEEKTRGEKEGGAAEETAGKSLGDSQTLVGGLAADEGTLDDGLELTDLSARYTIVKALGQGGMGEVLLATDNRLKRQVAIKRIRGEQARSRAAVKRFLTEAQAIAALNHPNIVQVYDYGRDQEGPFLIMEYVDGQSLLERCKNNPLPVEEAVELTCELLGGLGRAHELGIIHRDIKPGNILLTKDGRPKLTDFGLAKQTAADHGQTVTGAVLGTIDFMPPEQRRDSTSVDARSDLWSLAATLYQMLTGKSPKIIRFDLLPPVLVTALSKALEDEPGQRFQSAAEFRDGLRRSLLAEPTPDELVFGQCPKCGTKNENHVRFCRECASALKVGCLSCSSEISVWDKACTECGARQAELLERRRGELQQLQSEIERLCEAGKTGEALQRLESIGELRHPRLADYRNWLERIGPDLREQVGRLAELAVNALSEARAHRAAWDYLAAIRVLKSLPPEAAGDEHKQLQAQLESDWSELQQTLQEIQQRVKLKQLDGLLPLVQRAVQLRGDRADLKKLLGQLEQRETRLAAAPPPKAEADPLNDPFEQPAASVTLPGFLGKQVKRKPRLQQRPAIVAAGVAGLLLLLGVGWLLTGGRGVSGQQSAVTDDVGKTPASMPATTSSDARAPVSVFSLLAGTKSLESTEITNSIGMKLKLVTAGKFMMGEGAQKHQVTLTHSYYLGVYEVTQAHYLRVMNKNPSRFPGDSNPVEMVSWDDAIEFCRKLSALPQEKDAGRIYRLPTEAEWEYACRAGTDSKFSFGNDNYRIEDFAWYGYNSQNKPHPTGQKKSNPWGFHDMHGNVWEWCADGYAEYSVAAKTDPVVAHASDSRVNRGGSWSNDAASCRSACRFALPKGRGNSDLGFRIVFTQVNSDSSQPNPNPLMTEQTLGEPPANSGRKETVSSGADWIPADASTFGGHAYKFFPQQTTWKEAKSQCEALGGHLLIIESPEENAFAAQLIQRGGLVDCWLGITDEALEGSWKSVQGKHISYTNWYVQQPNNGKQQEHYGILSNAQLQSGGSIGWKWCDQANRAIELHKPGYICEWAREPQKK